MFTYRYGVPGVTARWRRSERNPGWARKYSLLSIHSFRKASSRPSGTRKLFISVTGAAAPLSASTAVRASGVTFTITLFPPRASLHWCAVTTHMYNQAGDDVKTDEGGIPTGSEDETGRYRQRRRTRAAIV